MPGDDGALKAEIDVLSRKIAECQEAVNSNPDDFKNRRRLSELEYEYYRMIRLDPNSAEGHFLVGRDLKGEGRLKEAEAEACKAIELDPRSLEAFILLGDVLRSLEDYQSAMDAYRRAIGIDPEDAQAYGGLGVTLQKVGDDRDALEQLHRAINIDPEYTMDLIHQCETDALRTLLNAGYVLPKVYHSDGNTPLYWAAWVGCVDMAKLLLDRGASVNAQNEDSEAALHAAMDNSHYEMALLLLQHGADIDITGFFGSVLHKAVADDNPEMVAFLTENGADVNVISDDGHTGTPLHRAVSGEVAEYLIAHGADVDAQDWDAATPLMEAARCYPSDVPEIRYVEVAEVLIRHGADINAQGHYNNWAPMHWAVWGRHRQMIGLLIARGADVNIRVKDTERLVSGWTSNRFNEPGPLSEAYRTKVHAGWTPLHLAAIQGYPEIALDLLNAGADPNISAESLLTPLHWARVMGNTEVAEILISHGAPEG